MSVEQALEAIAELIAKLGHEVECIQELAEAQQTLCAGVIRSHRDLTDKLLAAAGRVAHEAGRST